jgi:hypothetical protein
MTHPPAGPPMHGARPPGPTPAERSSIQTSAIILIVVGFLCGGTLPSIFGIIALVQMETDVHSARQMNKIGWIIFWVIVGLIILAVIAYVLFFVLILGVALTPAIFGG